MSFRITEETPYTDPHSRGTGSIVTERKGYILRTRGEHNRMVRHDYLCPVHGVFEAMVSSGDVPDTMPCTVLESDWVSVCGPTSATSRSVSNCRLMSPWQSPVVGQGWAAGTVKT